MLKVANGAFPQPPPEGALPATSSCPRRGCFHIRHGDLATIQAAKVALPQMLTSIPSSSIMAAFAASALAAASESGAYAT